VGSVDWTRTKQTSVLPEIRRWPKKIHTKQTAPDVGRSGTWTMGRPR